MSGITEYTVGIILFNCPSDTKTGGPPEKREYQPLVLKSRTSYAFCHFLTGQYNAKDEIGMNTLFSAMTALELTTIESCDFNTIWQLRWVQINRNDHFHRKYKIFEANWLDGPNPGERLRRLIARAQPTINERWMFPRGHQNTWELPLDAALREFEEETKIPVHSIQVFSGARWAVRVHQGAQTYQMEFFAAITTCDVTPRIHMGSTQVSEVVDIRWVPRRELKRMDPTGVMWELANAAATWVKKEVHSPGSQPEKVFHISSVMEKPFHRYVGRGGATTRSTTFNETREGSSKRSNAFRRK